MIDAPLRAHTRKQIKSDYYIHAHSAPKNESSVAQIARLWLIGDDDEAAPRDVDDAWTAGLLDGPVGRRSAVDDVVTALTAFGVLVAGNNFVVFPSTTKAVAPDARQTCFVPTVMQPPAVRTCPLML